MSKDFEKEHKLSKRLRQKNDYNEVKSYSTED